MIIRDGLRVEGELTVQKVIGVMSQTRYGRFRFGSLTRNTSTPAVVRRLKKVIVIPLKFSSPDSSVRLWDNAA